MTNTKELQIEMLKNGENGYQVASFLGITHATFSRKLNNLSEFSQKEIVMLKEHWNLSIERVGEIFFAN